MSITRTTWSKAVAVILILFAGAGIQACRSRETRPGGSASPGPVLPAALSQTTPVISYADVVGKAAPAVVTIRSERRVRAPRMFPFMNDPFFRDFFGDQGARAPRQQIQQGLGSGVIVTPDGYVLTNHHVVDGAEEIQVETADHRNLRAKLVGSDPPSDMAVLRIDGRDLPVLTLGDSDKVRVGDVVLALGNPLGVGQTVTAGIISAKERSTGLGNGTYESFLQTDAPINQGNSGGALVNTAGELIGINSQILSTSGAGGNIGIGFAIPSNMARQVSEQLIKNRNVRRGLIGVTVQDVTPDMAANLGLKRPGGVIVNSVQRGGPAERAGIRQGDVITQLNGSPVENSNQLRNSTAATAPGTEVILTVFRDGTEQQIRVKVGELSSEADASAPGQGGDTEQGRYGMSVSPLTPDLAGQLGVPSGAGLVVTELDPMGAAAQAGIRTGDLIVQANRKPVRGTNDLRDVLQTTGNNPVLLLIQRGRDQFFVTLRP